MAVTISSPDALVRAYGRDPRRISGEIGIPVHHLWRPESGLPGLTCLVANRPSIFINDASLKRDSKAEAADKLGKNDNRCPSGTVRRKDRPPASLSQDRNLRR